VGRLQKTLRLQGFASFKQFYDYLLEDKSGAALDALINQISTNHTFFTERPHILLISARLYCRN
jgi:chemotaxis protein methyltransferase CheR